MLRYIRIYHTLHSILLRTRTRWKAIIVGNWTEWMRSSWLEPHLDLELIEAFLLIFHIDLQKIQQLQRTKKLNALHMIRRVIKCANIQLIACNDASWAHLLLQFNISMGENTTRDAHSFSFFHSHCFTWFPFIEQVYDVHWMKIRIIISFPFILITVVDDEVYSCTWVCE